MRIKIIRKISAAALLLIWLVAPQAAAPAQETESAAELRRCAAIDNTGERHRCYDRVLRPGPVDAPPALPTAGPAAATPTAGQAPATPTVALPPAAPPPAPEITPEKAATPPAGPAQAGRRRFGVKDRRPQEPDFIDVVIVLVSKSKIGKMTFRTGDGQVWQQADNRRPPVYRKTPFSARIKKGTLGSFFMKPDKGGYAVRVKRRK